jgi:hypothetical protein
MSDQTQTHEQIKVIGTVSEHRTAHGEIFMGPIPKAVRFQRGLRNLLICFGLMVIGALIPILHLILLFGFFSLGIFLFFNSYLDDVEIAKGELVCETCQSKIAFASKPDLFPFWVDCPKCNVSIAVKKDIPI